jgi:arginase family enzyme
VRDASQYVKRYHIGHDVDVCDALSIADAGDAPVQPYDLEANAQGMAHWADGLDGGSRARLFAVGGDHSIAYANLLSTWQRRGKPAGGLALVHFDSHLDTVDEVWGNKWGHASPFIRAIEAGIVDPKSMISVGIKGPLNRRDDLDFARDHGVTILMHDAVPHRGAADLQAFVKRLNGREVYVTFDVDVLDPAFAPGTGTPCPGGITSAQAFDLLRALRGASVCGGDVVEVLPDRDVAGNTALVAAHVLFEVLALSAIR